MAWWGLLAPARTPASVIERMREAMAKALNEPPVKTALGEQGLLYDLSDGAAFGGFIESEIVRWGKVVKDNQINAGQ